MITNSISVGLWRGQPERREKHTVLIINRNVNGRHKLLWSQSPFSSVIHTR